MAGINVTQQSLSVIAGNVANANTPGYVEESINQVEIGTPAFGGTSVNSAGINRNLNTLLQSQLWTETSGGAYADTASQLYQQLQQVYGTPGSSTSFDAIYNNFTTALQALSASPASSIPSRPPLSALPRRGAKSQLDDDERSSSAHAIRTGDCQRRPIGKLHCCSRSRQINRQLEGSSTTDSSAAALQDQRDQDITQLTQLMNVRVVRGSNNQISLFTGTGLQLVAVSRYRSLLSTMRNAVGDVGVELQPERR